MEPVILIASKPPQLGIAAFSAIYSNISVAFNPKDPFDSLTIPKTFAHEAGHYIFQGLENREYPAFARLRKARENHNRAMEYMKPAMRMMAADPTCHEDGCECSKKLEEFQAGVPAELKNAEAQLASVARENSAELSKVGAIDGRYHELFADVVSAVYFENPEANADALDHTHRATRSFTEAQINFKPTEEPHDAFAPLRRDLWRKWILPRLRDKRELLRELAEAFWAEIKIQINEGPVD